MGDFVDGLLAFSRLGRQPLQLRHVDVARIVEQVLEDLAAEREGRRVEIVIGELPPCEADPILLRQVFANLLGNASKYSAERDPSRIEIDGYVSADAGEIVYSVRDNGVGFDMAYADKLFEVFQRLHRAEEYEGIGIGLALAQRIVHRHGGRIWAESAVDQGAMFAFTIPLIPDRAEPSRL
jgi:light-regulated signal transduction histidine kinase (bacteriophytochrome)